jgi:aspartate/methionine/tyrosine aminotransferase
MKNIFSSRTTLPPSATLAVTTLARKKRLSGEYVFNLSGGDPAINTAKYLQKTVDLALETGQTNYPPVRGLDELRSRASFWMNDLYKTNFTEKNTLVTCGGRFGIYLLLQALLNDGDEVVIIAPHWVSYPPMVRLCGGRPVIVQTEEKQGWKVKPEQIAAACSPKTKLLIFNNGSNPTGVLYEERELQEIAKLCKEKNILLLSDEVYSGLTYDDNAYVSCGSFWNLAENVVVIQSCSKNFAMTGWRVGFAFGPAEIINKMARIQGQSITNTSIVSQFAAIAAVQQAQKITAEVNKEMKSRRDFFTEAFNRTFKAKIPAPASAFYNFIPLSAFGTWFDDDQKFCKKMLEEANVAMLPGTAFGKPGYVRTSFVAKPQELEAALKALAAHIKK